MLMKTFFFFYFAVFLGDFFDILVDENLVKKKMNDFYILDDEEKNFLKRFFLKIKKLNRDVIKDELVFFIKNDE